VRQSALNANSARQCVNLSRQQARARTTDSSRCDRAKSTRRRCRARELQTSIKIASGRELSRLSVSSPDKAIRANSVKPRDENERGAVSSFSRRYERTDEIARIAPRDHCKAGRTDLS